MGTYRTLEFGGGLMVSVRVSGLSGRGWSTGGDIVLCSWSRHYFTLTVPRAFHQGV